MPRWPSTPAQRAREDFGGKDSGKCTESEPHVPSLVMQEDASAGGQRVDSHTVSCYRSPYTSSRSITKSSFAAARKQQGKNKQHVDAGPGLSLDHQTR